VPHPLLLLEVPFAALLLSLAPFLLALPPLFPLVLPPLLLLLAQFLPRVFALLRRHALPAIHVAQQLLPLVRIGIHHPPQRVAQLLALLRGQRAELLPRNRR